MDTMRAGNGKVRAWMGDSAWVRREPRSWEASMGRHDRELQPRRI